MSRGGWQDAAEEVIRLRKRVEELEAQNKEWIKENSPGGWIDSLRQQLQPAKELSDMILVANEIVLDIKGDFTGFPWPEMVSKAREFKKMEAQGANRKHHNS